MFWLKVAKIVAKMSGHSFDDAIDELKRRTLQKIWALTALIAVGSLSIVTIVLFGFFGMKPPGIGIAPAGAAAATGNQCDAKHPVTVALTPLAELDAEQSRNAATIIGVGKRLKITSLGILYGLAIAYQESGYRNILVAVDHDSLGIFQQRPSQGWGTPAQLTDPVYAATAFFQRMTQNVPMYNQVELWVVVQGVQNPASDTLHTDDQWLPLAKRVLTAAGIAAASPPSVSTVCGNPGSNSPQMTKVLAAATDALAKQWTYVWDAGNANGPTKAYEGTGCDGAAIGGCNAIGFDCSGLTKWVYAQASITLPHQTNDQLNSSLGKPVSVDHLQPGDLVFFGTLANVHHVGIFIRKDGENYLMIDTPTEGEHVMTHYFYGPKDQEGDFVAARRYV
jgi:cell wall-associated NlpC family hydrolase